jgi:hypothetical protein
MRKIAAAVARKVIGLLRFMGLTSGQGLAIREVPCRQAACRRPPDDTSGCTLRGRPTGPSYPCLIGLASSVSDD